MPFIPRGFSMTRVLAAAVAAYLLISLGPARSHPQPFPHTWLKDALCVHSGIKNGQRVGWGEGSCHDRGAPYYGGMQFDLGTWRANGGYRYARMPYHARPHHQLHVAFTLWKR